MSKPDGVLEIEFNNQTATVRYFETSGIPKSANIEILEDNIGIENPLGVGIHHQSNVPIKVTSCIALRIRKKEVVQDSYVVINSELQAHMNCFR